MRDMRVGSREKGCAGAGAMRVGYFRNASHQPHTSPVIYAHLYSTQSVSLFMTIQSLSAHLYSHSIEIIKYRRALL